MLSVLSWAVSNTLLISEFIARGPTGAFDEFIEVLNASTTAIDLGDYKLDYASTGGSISNRVTWSPGTLLPAGKRFLAANTASVTYYSFADAGYSTGIADNGQLAIRRQSDDSVVDAVAWGACTLLVFGNTDTTLGFPNPNTSSRERLPLGINTTDTDINLNDFAVQPSPNPQSLGIPRISNPMRLPFVPYAGQTAAVSAIIVPSGGNTITGATVFWSLNSVSQTPILLNSISSVYYATLSGQAEGSLVQYTITAYDNAANTVTAQSGYLVGTTFIVRMRQHDATLMVFQSTMGLQRVQSV
ncbi:MAG: lamin tail domain-containing protein [bacterium]|nr:lamin tail domain-containing protein [bacterium]